MNMTMTNFWMYIYKNHNQRKNGIYVEFKARTYAGLLKRVIKEMKARKGKEAIVCIEEWDKEFKGYTQSDFGVMRALPSDYKTIYKWSNVGTEFQWFLDSGIVNEYTGEISRPVAKSKK